MWYFRRLPDGLVVMQTRPEHAPQLEELQRVCFPTLDDAERFKAEHYRRHLGLFADGQFVALDGDRVVGASIAYDYGAGTEGWVQQVATAASHRRMGIGRALIESSFAGFHAAGRRQVGLSTDSRTGALDLYERIGMKVKRSFTAWAKDLD